MVVTKQTIKDEISKRLGLKGMGNYDSYIKSTPANAKPVQSFVGRGSVAPMGNKISKEQAAADFKTKTGAGEPVEKPRDILETTKSIMGVGKDTKHHDEDVDNLIYAIGSYFPTEAIIKAVPLLKGLISKLGSKTFKPEAVEAAIEKGFKSHSIKNPPVGDRVILENYTPFGNYQRPPTAHNFYEQYIPGTDKKISINKDAMNKVLNNTENINGIEQPYLNNELVSDYVRGLPNEPVNKYTLDEAYNIIKERKKGLNITKPSTEYLSDENVKFLMEEFLEKNAKDDADIVKRLKSDRKGEGLNYPDYEGF